MGLKNKYIVESATNNEVIEWITKKHYAKRTPIMQYCFGLFSLPEKTLCGVCIFSPAPSRFWNNGGKLFNDKHKIDVYELSRLILNDGHEKNLTSFFVSRCLKLIPKPNVIVSYADKNQHHSGYIYQATNFIYTGEAEPKNKSFDFVIYGKKYHCRNMNIEFTRKLLGTNYDENIHWKDNIIAVGGEIIPQLPKHRYIFINAKNKQQLVIDMIYNVCEYPKHQNQNYNTDYKPTIQTKLF